MTSSNPVVYVFGTAHYRPLYIQAILMKHGFDVRGHYQFWSELVEITFKPEFIGFSC